MSKYSISILAIFLASISFATACGQYDNSMNVDISVTEDTSVNNIATTTTTITINTVITSETTTVTEETTKESTIEETTTKATSTITDILGLEDITNTDTFTTVEQYYTDLSSVEYDMVCAVVQAETIGGSIEFKEYVAGIIYNRVQSEDFPNSVYGVLTQEGQFGSVSNYYYNTYPIDDDTRLAVSKIFSGQDSYILYNLNGAISYCNPNLVSYSTLSWFESNLKFTYQCTEYADGITWVHRFYAMP